MGKNRALDRYFLAATGKATPRICFVGTASGDAESYRYKFYEAMSELDCRAPTSHSFSRRARISGHSIAAANGFGHVRITPDLITSKLSALHFYQIAIPAPRPPSGSFHVNAARRCRIPGLAYWSRDGFRDFGHAAAVIARSRSITSPTGATSAYFDAMSKRLTAWEVALRS